jgi:hypothetical protein
MLTAVTTDVSVNVRRLEALAGYTLAAIYATVAGPVQAHGLHGMRDWQSLHTGHRVAFLARRGDRQVRSQEATFMWCGSRRA